jgi:hypothetical protein
MSYLIYHCSYMSVTLYVQKKKVESKVEKLSVLRLRAVF